MFNIKRLEAFATCFDECGIIKRNITRTISDKATVDPQKMAVYLRNAIKSAFENDGHLCCGDVYFDSVKEEIEFYWEAQNTHFSKANLGTTGLGFRMRVEHIKDTYAVLEYGVCALPRKICECSEFTDADLIAKHWAKWRIETGYREDITIPFEQYSLTNVVSTTGSCDTTGRQANARIFMEDKRIIIQKQRAGTCYLASSIFDHTDDCLYVEVSSCDEFAEFEIDRETAKRIIETIVEHFKKRHNLTDDEADAIARLI